MQSPAFNYTSNIFIGIPTDEIMEHSTVVLGFWTLFLYDFIVFHTLNYVRESDPMNDLWPPWHKSEGPWKPKERAHKKETHNTPPLIPTYTL